jgi:alkanesulfonate monooxygenase SsuD/methylene tetrahydromethanopterin reductase-like flavin-dependent oxidoreductase (luciferase family)
MLPNHSPLVIAEQFGTLEALYPGRIDLGLGRAPAPTRRRRGRCGATSLRPRRISRGRGGADGLSCPTNRGRRARGAGRGAKVPVWILGSSLFGAQLAAMLGLPMRFALAFRAGPMMQAIEVYRANVQAVGQLASPT